MAGSVAIRIAYGHTVNDSNDEFIRSAEDFMTAVGEVRFVPSWVPGAGFKRWTEAWAEKTVRHRQAPFDSAVKKIVRRCAATVGAASYKPVNVQAEGTAEPSFISKLLEPEDPTQVVNAEEREMIKVIASSLYGAGADTTSSVLQFFFLAMTLYPAVQAKAQAEIDDYLASSSDKSARLISMADREHLPYTRAVISEALRWHPVINLAVHNTESNEESVFGYRIPGNTMVIANIWAILHDPAVYTRPDEFCPDRYFGDEPAPDPALYAFGFGRRADGTEITPKESFTNDVLSRLVLSNGLTRDIQRDEQTPTAEDTQLQNFVTDFTTQESHAP
ncbi:hypothetical protein FRC10_007290 [Ceratobasidium sp. 414]|nr:hypothetical protein FRC10_007290 [Ceratobasidium sp. 414]